MFVCPECGQAQPAQGHCPADGTPLAPIGEDVLLGARIGVSRVARLLGIGGMGRVYKGVHPTIGSRVAIKVLSPECSDRRDLVERFFAEAKAVNLIRHESIVNVLDLAMLPDGRPYIIMEYLDGAPLAAHIDHAVRHQMPLPLGGIAPAAGGGRPGGPPPPPRGAPGSRCRRAPRGGWGGGCSTRWAGRTPRGSCTATSS